jgi:hypothetical protein
MPHIPLKFMYLPAPETSVTRSLDKSRCGGAESVRKGEFSCLMSSIRKPIWLGRESAITKNWKKSCLTITVPC